MKKLLILSAVISLTLNLTYAQESNPYGYYLDAARFSQTTPGGTARIQGLAGTNIALGADISSIFNNPAGIGLYNRSVVSFTPSYTFNTGKGSYLGETREMDLGKFAIDNLGVVFSGRKNQVGGWQGGAFGLGINKINDFNQSLRYTGTNSENSIADYFVQSANGATTDQFPSLDDAVDLTSLAYHNYLIGPITTFDPDGPDDEYFSDVVSFARPNMRQEEVINQSGGQYQVTAAYGGNYGDFLYFGMNLGLTLVDYQISKTYSESSFDYSASDPDYDPISSITVTEDLAIEGTGFNASFGLIIRPVSFLRFGASVTTPTKYNLNDNYSTSVSTEWNDFVYADLIGGDTVLTSLNAQSPLARLNYQIRTPVKFSGGAAIFFGDVGFVSLDAEYLDYSQMRLSAADISMDADNDYIRNNYSNSLNLRAGGEIRIDVLRFRAGYALNNVPTDQTIDFNNANHRLSAGFGLMLDKVFFDIALVNNRVKSQFSPYVLADNSEPVVDATVNNFSGLLSIGFNF